MTFLGLEQPVAYGREQVFDPTTAQMVLNANRDYINAIYRDYQQAMADMKEFNKEYGNFLSPFARDMERYNQIVGGIQNGIEDLYNRGIDPLRSSEGRAYVTRMINSVNPAELAAMKSNAKLGYAYLDAMQALRKAGKYSQAQEDFDIALNGETAFNDFATGNGSGGFNTWGRISPIEATTLRDLTYDHYKGRTARDLTREDFKTDPSLRNYAYDPRYQYSGYLDSDLMKVAPGASASLAADPRAAFFRDQARQKVIASGKEPTAEAVEAQFQRDIADANAWALIDPTKRADQFALQDQAHRNAMESIRLQNKLQEEREREKYDHQLQLQALKNQGKVASKYKSLGNQNNQAVYHVTEETQLDGIYKQLKELGIKIPRLTIKDGKIMRQVDKNGNQLYRDIDDASAEELRYAAAHKNQLLRAVSTKMKSLSNQYGPDYINNQSAQTDFLNTFGYKIGGVQANAFFKNKKPAENGGILLSKEDLKKMETLPTIMASTFNSGKKYSDEGRLMTNLKAWDSDNGNAAYKRINDQGKAMNIQWSFDSTSPINAIEVPSKNGGTEVLLKGTSRIQWGDTAGDMMDVEQWLPIGLVSEKAAKSGNHVKASDFELRGENRSGYLDIDAGYMKDTGSQKQANPALTDLGLESVESMADSYYDQNLLAEILNQLQ